ncbi:hypothetical protein Q9L58_002519 [Maublancomyces gigas]|uniref:RNA polymerase II subunit B1 CTD phosphatase RPAP2 homolog n=1 Tax=Discina gigas TaxID=1032678 RepID=A0ABR3GR39_9PEZI
MPPKSILKKPTYKSSPLNPSTTPPDIVSIAPPSTTGTKPTPSEARAIALSHAHALQIRKVLELSILTSIETLVDYPSPASLPIPTTTTAATTHHDALALKRHLRYFQPADYDSLLEERNILTHCGYPLCGAPKKSSPTASTYVLVDKGRTTMRFVERTKLERFCSDTCARRGLWLRVQLNDEPSWLRGDVLEGVEVGSKGEVFGLDLEGLRWAAAGGEDSMLLLEEVEERRRIKEGGVAGVASEVDLKRLVEELQGLGIESKDLLAGKKQNSGETAISFAADKPLAFTIEEKTVSSNAVPPSTDVTPAMAALAIEGYNPRRGPQDYLKNGKRSEGEKLD